FVLVLVVTAALFWAVAAWLFLSTDSTLVWQQRFASVGLLLLSTAWLIYALRFEDKLPDYLKEVVGQLYYEADGVSFMPMIRIQNGQPELSVYYQNRFENPACTIVHLRPLEEGFAIREGWRDVHFAFKAGGGDFGVIHQPITVPEQLRGEVINLHLAASSYYPRGAGSRVRKHAGLHCGSMLIDWQGAAFKTGVHQVSGEIELIRPANLHLALPRKAGEGRDRRDWRQEQLHAGNLATR
ncbi:MAG: hypothetical protein ACYTGC_12220, partial [Planctomycetota bacterium]